MWCFVYRIVLLGFALPLFCGAIKNYCTLCEFGAVHTLCKYRKVGPGPLCQNYKIEPLTLEDKAEVLLVHNELRNKVAKGDEIRGYPGPQPSASNMRQMSWDHELEKIAQRWADQCLPYHEKEQYDECRNIDKISHVSQNVGTSRTVSGNKDVIPQITGWYDAVGSFNSNFMTFFNHALYSANANGSHYVSLIWGTAYRLGCARVIFDEDNHMGGVLKVVRLVCNYGPTRRNLFMNNLYKIGAPCSQCPEGTACSPIFDALCATDSQIGEYKYIEKPEETTLSYSPRKHWGRKYTSWEDHYGITTNKHFKLDIQYLRRYMRQMPPSSAKPSNTQLLEDHSSPTTPPGNDPVEMRTIVSVNILDSLDGPKRTSSAEDYDYDDDEDEEEKQEEEL